MKVELEWATTEGDFRLAKMARVSAPENIHNDYVKLISYLLRRKEISPFEMVDACLYIETTRDISRQILRHRSFSFQEFSQRYASVEKLGDPVYRECRMQDHKNRQSSLACEDAGTAEWWEASQAQLLRHARDVYAVALERGIAKEQARAILPEGLTPTRMFMKGSLRSWLHYCDLRMKDGTQKEHRDVAAAAWAIIAEHFPAACAAWDEVRGA